MTKICSRGMALIEVLLVMVIMGMVSTTAYLYVPGYFDRARDVRRKSDLEKIRYFLEDYYNQNDTYPSKLPACNLGYWFCDPETKFNYYYETGPEGNGYFRVYTKLKNTQDLSIVKANCLSGCGPSCIYNYGVSSRNTKLKNCDIQYACAPGTGNVGSCEAFDDPALSKCPQIYLNDPTCKNQCGKASARCKNSSGKNKPDEVL